MEVMSQVLINENILNNNSTSHSTQSWTDDGWSTDDQPFYDPTDPGEGEPIYEDDEQLIPPDPRLPINPPPVSPRTETPKRNLLPLGLLALYLIA
jgi:hypothetical protein